MSMREFEVAKLKIMTPPFKDNIPWAGLAVGCVVNGFMVTQCVFDYSVDLYATAGFPATVDAERLSFLAAYYGWRLNSPPLLGPIGLALLLPLPVFLVLMARDAAQSLFGWRQATALRHAADCTQFGTICVIVAVLATLVLPGQSAVLDQCPHEKQCAEVAAALTPAHLAMLLLNLVMCTCEFVKFAGNLPAGVPPSKKDD